MVGESPARKQFLDAILRVGPERCSVLILGETGSGKELAALLVHVASGRTGGFNALNCASVSPALADAELFGHARGAFTNAVRSRPGLVAASHGGTLFLDEVDSMPLEIQARLLRVLEQGTIRPVGADKEVPLDLRIVAATNADLEVAVAEGRFRDDLLRRLEGFIIRIPPLRERGRDVILIARAFLLKLRPDVRIVMTRAAEMVMLSHSWPGNVREVQTLLRHLVIGRQLRRILAVHVREGLGLPAPELRLGATWEERVKTLLSSEGSLSVSNLCESLQTGRTTIYRALEPLLGASEVGKRKEGREVLFWLEPGRASEGPADGPADEESGLSLSALSEAIPAKVLGTDFQSGAPERVQVSLTSVAEHLTEKGASRVTADGLEEEDASRVAEVLALARESWVSRKRLVEALGMSERTASRLLSRLEKEGQLEQQGSGRGSRYVVGKGGPGIELRPIRTGAD